MYVDNRNAKDERGIEICIPLKIKLVAPNFVRIQNPWWNEAPRREGPTITTPDDGWPKSDR